VVDAQLFKDVMARIPSAVAVITMTSDAGHRGVTVSAFSSLSLDPPLVLACIDVNNQSHDILAHSEAYTINVLSRGQTFLAEQFAGQTPLADPGFVRVAHSLGSRGIPRINDCVVWIECRPWARYSGGDHTIFVSEIERLGLGEHDDPLVYFDRSFVELSW
jgi:flavin reductase (DIM6/NTAB) family NADH-FMN oxidoreductase RutF